MVSEWLGQGPGGEEDVTGWEQEIGRESAQLDALIDRCLLDLPRSLQECSAPIPDELAAPPALALAPPASAAARLGARLPRVPGQPSRSAREGGGEGSGPPRAGQRRGQRWDRVDLGKMRGVDPSTAPEALRCAIDGKLLGEAVRSPYGHLFERATLERWIALCGSVCPVTGGVLRLEDCHEDEATAREVLDWAKRAKADYRARAAERKQRRTAGRAGDLETAAMAGAGEVV